MSRHKTGFLEDNVQGAQHNTGFYLCRGETLFPVYKQLDIRIS